MAVVNKAQLASTKQKKQRKETREKSAERTATKERAGSMFKEEGKRITEKTPEYVHAYV